MNLQKIFLSILLTTSFSCSQVLTNNERLKVKSFFGEWESRASKAKNGSEIIKLQLEFNKDTLSFFSEVLKNNLTNKEKEKVFQAFKFHHTTLNQFFSGKLEAALQRKK